MRLSPSFLALAAAIIPSATVALPFQKRIDQQTIASVQPWENACTAAGGGEQCNPIAVNAAATLLAAAGPCEQQDNADKMIDLAKQLNNNADMIKFAQIFAQQPRNTPSGQAVTYCQSAPANQELNGLFQCQFAGADESTFVTNVPVGQAGTIPFGLSSPVSPPGSCPANPSGPIPDGQQLADITQDPGLSNVGSSGSSSNSSSSNSSASASDAASSAASTATSTDSGDDSDCSAVPPVTVTSIITVTAAATATDAGSASATDTIASATATANPVLAASNPATSSTTAPPALSSAEIQQNAVAAQKLNASFKTLTQDSSCTTGDNACINGSFAQCGPSGAWVLTPCASTETCVALPLVKSSGTSITCDTQKDAVARFQQAGVTGGIDGSS